jgi:diguanylate cyclase (GGDEF)-like protein
MGRSDLDNGRRLYTMDLRVANDDSPGTLVVEVDPTSAAELPASDADIYSALVPFLVCINNELRLNTELDDMAAELTVRYEELNLVYHTEDQVSLFDEGQNALQKLVGNCADYLDVRLAALYMREKDLFVVSDASDELIDVDLLEKSLKGAVYGWVQKHHEPVVINDADDKHGDLVGELRCKLLACPVLDSGNDVDGVLFMTNELSRPDFTNSDKNLLAVMAKKVTKIVQGSYDDLTGLMNRRSFEHLVERNLAAIQQTEITHSLLLLNVDRLHVINDTRGYEAGNEILTRIADQLRESVQDADIVARIGGDEFGILVLNCSLEQGSGIAHRLRTLIEKTVYRVADDAVKITGRFGISCVSTSTNEVEDALVAAHVACDAARDQGGNRVQTYEHDDQMLLQRENHMQMIGHLHSALHADRFVLYAQLIAPLVPKTGRHLEILIRMIGDDGEPVPPELFLPAAGRYQLMPEMDRWVVKRACQMLAEGSAPSKMPDTVFAINLSGQSFSDEGFLPFVEKVLDQFDIPGKMICFEITETAAMANMSQAQAFMAALKQRGCSFALDDFGAGLSSFGYLKSFPVDYLKIDGALVKGIVEDPVAESMVAAVNQVGHVMGIQTVAEFVDTSDIKEKLRMIGVDYVQGYEIQEPQPLIEQLNEW